MSRWQGNLVGKRCWVKDELAEVRRRGRRARRVCEASRVRLVCYLGEKLAMPINIKLARS